MDARQERAFILAYLAFWFAVFGTVLRSGS